MMANRDQDIKERLLAIFRVEAEEHLQALTANLLALENGVPPEQAREVIEATFREAHTLKGAARSVGLMDVEAVCQAMESLLRGIMQGRLALNPPMLNCLQEAVDGVARLLSGSANSTAAPDLVRRLEEAGARGQGLVDGDQNPTPQPPPPNPPLFSFLSPTPNPQPPILSFLSPNLQPLLHPQPPFPMPTASGFPLPNWTRCSFRRKTFWCRSLLPRSGCGKSRRWSRRLSGGQGIRGQG